jgi:hypothetical protein
MLGSPGQSRIEIPEAKSRQPGILEKRKPAQPKPPANQNHASPPTIGKAACDDHRD